MEGVQEGTSITHQIIKICESLTQEEVYMILQEVFNVDCGLNQMTIQPQNYHFH